MIGGGLLLIVLGGYISKDTITSLTDSGKTMTEKEVSVDIEVVAEKLAIPWEIVFLPDNSILVTERPGNLLHIDTNQTRIPVAGVEHIGEGGLLGMALHPEFQTNHFLYLYLTTQTPQGLENRVERYVFENSELSDKTPIISEIPGAKYHDGGRIAFGPDGYLYIAAGDGGDEDAAQDKNSLNGSILRVSEDGSIPDNNPFGTAVYSYGHRNVQGLAWDDEARLWATEHGRSGIQSGFDELNLIVPGANYGWPVIEGDESKVGMTSPILQSGADDTWAPGGITYFKNSLYFAGLRGAALYRVRLKAGKAEKVEMYLREEYGRLRTVQIGPDGFIYILTSNTDGRGKAQENDDKILRINPAFFSK